MRVGSAGRQQRHATRGGRPIANPSILAHATDVLRERLHMPANTRFCCALTAVAWIAASAPAGPDHGSYAALVVSGCAGAIIALNQRGIAGLAAIGLALGALVATPHTTHPNLLVPIALLTSSALMGRVLMPRVPTAYWSVVLFVIALLLKLAMVTGPGQGAAAGGIVSTVALMTVMMLIAHATFEATRMLWTDHDVIGGMQYALADRNWLSETSRYLLLGRIAGGIAHELSQAMNVIGMANGNLGYILARAEVPEPFGTELSQRVGKIAYHSSAAATMLGQFRWFGLDGQRDGAEMTVRTALERAILATRSETRKSGITVEIRGDAISHPVPLRHGLIEMLASTALSELTRILADRPSDGKPPEAIALEATRTETAIEIAVVSSGESTLMRPRSHPHGHDANGIDQITYALVSRLAASFQAEIIRLEPQHHPVCFRLRLPRDIV